MKNKIVEICICMLLVIGGISVNATSINCNDNKMTDSINNKYSFENPPTSFDLRNVNGENYVTGVKNQSDYGTCWAFGEMAAMESNLLITGNWKNAGEDGEPDLSESHLDWWNGFNRFNNDDAFGSPGLTVHWGGECRTASAYFSRGEGALRERDAPYNEISNPPEITNPSYHYYYINDIEWYDIGEDLSNMDLIKNKIMTYGAISISYCVNTKYDEFLDENYTHYQPPTSNLGIDHIVAIIGWDDNKVTSAPEKGAWLCKNSWGASWGLDGYFWISYYDKYCCHYDTREWTASFQGVEPMPYNQIYYHDYHGWQGTLTKSTEAFNTFYSASNNTLLAVSFFTSTDNVDYIVRIYDTFENNELKGELSNISGTIPHRGFHTLDLDQPVSLNPDDNFYIYLKLSNGGQPYDRTIESNEWWAGVRVKSISHPGESYYYDNGNWHDLYDLDKTANFCIKGLATRDIPKLNITIKPGFGLGINLIVTNNGLDDATYVPWMITVKGGFLGMISKRKTGTIDIPAGESKTVSTGMFLGLGSIVISTRVDIYAKTVNGTQLLIFSIVK